MEYFRAYSRLDELECATGLLCRADFWRRIFICLPAPTCRPGLAGLIDLMNIAGYKTMANRF